MRVVSLNMDLADLIAITKAVDAYLEQCCRADGTGDVLCENCRSLEATRGELSRVARAPKLRPAAPERQMPAPPDHPLRPASLSFGARRPPLRVVSRAEARG